MTAQMEVRKGYMKFQRLGPIQHTKQKKGGHAPEKLGIWAFPYPFFDMLYAAHKYEKIAPKWIYNQPEDMDEEAWESAYDRWWKKDCLQIMKPTTFWYRGDLYSHILHNGDIGVDSSLLGFVNTEDITWTMMDTGLFHEHLKRINPGRKVKSGPGKGMPYSTEFTEVFIPARSGSLRSSTP